MPNMKEFKLKKNITPSQPTPHSPHESSPKYSQLFSGTKSRGPPLCQHRIQIEKVEAIVQSILPWKERVLECIKNRETILDRFNHISRQKNSRLKSEQTQDKKKFDLISRLICGLRDASLCTVEAIDAWARKMYILENKIQNINNAFPSGFNSALSNFPETRKKSRKKVKFRVAHTPNKIKSNYSNDENSLERIDPPHAKSEKRLASQSSLPNITMNGILRSPEDMCYSPTNPEQSKPMRFIWRGGNYLTKMLSDTVMLKYVPYIFDIMGSDFTIDRNPFLLPLATLENTLLFHRSSYVNTDSYQALSLNEKLDAKRIESASLILLSLEEDKGRNRKYEDVSLETETEQDIKQKPLSISSMDTVHTPPFPLPMLNREELQDYSSMPRPPLSIATIIACTRMLLKCDENSSVGCWDSIPPLTAAMVCRLLRQPVQPILSNLKAFYREYDPHTSVSSNTLHIIYPIILNSKIDPIEIERKHSRSIGILAAWLKNIVLFEVDKRIREHFHKESHLESSIPSEAQKIKFDKIFVQEMINTHFSEEEPLLFSEWGDGNDSSQITKNEKQKETKELKAKIQKKKNNKCSSKLKKKNHNDNSNSCMTYSLSKYHLDNSLEQVLTSDNDDFEVEQIPESIRTEIERVPTPLPILVNMMEGRKSIVIVNDCEVGNLKYGDILRIGDVHKSADWLLIRDKAAHLSKPKFILDKPYKHYDFLTNVDAVENEEKDNEHEWKNLKIWKLIPKELDKREPWRRQYDDCDVPWIDHFDTDSGNATNFNVVLPWWVVEDSCRDALYGPEHCLHEQRVFYFKQVSLSKIIEETFDSMCRWHPTGNAVDNVKWSKLARKMKFLSNIKNTGHEVDMAFVRQMRLRRDRKLDLEAFSSILEDVALIQYPCLQDGPNGALRKLLWNTVVMLPSVNFMAWSDAKEMAIITEGRRLCAQIRIASFYRKVFFRVNYIAKKRATSLISKYGRRKIAMVRLDRRLKALHRDHIFRVRFLAALVCQNTWRRYHIQLHLYRSKEFTRKNELEEIATYRAFMNKRRKTRESTIVFKQIEEIHETFVLIVMKLNDQNPFEKSCSLEILAYIPRSQESFKFIIEEKVLRDCLHDTLGKNGPLSWNEILLSPSLQKLTHRISLRIVNKRPIVLFSKRNINERGKLIMKRGTSFYCGVFVLSIYRSPFDVVICVYDPRTCKILRTSVLMSKLVDWIKRDEDKQQRLSERKKVILQPKHKHKSSNEKSNHTCNQTSDTIGAVELFLRINSYPRLLVKENEKELISWLVQRIDVVKNEKNLAYYKLILQCDAENERRNKVTCVLQSMWRRKKQKKETQLKIYEDFEKAFDREKNAYYYVNKKTGSQQWVKPYLLGDADLDLPKDKWRREKRKDEKNGIIRYFYKNLATGQKSWLSESDAAQIVQRRFRERQCADLLETKISLATLAKAVKFIRDTEANYTVDSSKLSNQFNFALLCFSLKFEISLAKKLLKEAYSRSPTHPIISRTYGIFILAICKPPRKSNFLDACRMFREAEATDPGGEMFKIAYDNFFHWAVISHPNNTVALLNYTLIHQCIFKDIEKTEKLYRKTLSLDPTNTFVLQNFEMFEEERYPGGIYANGSPSSVVLERSSIVNDEKYGCGEWHRMSDSLCRKPTFKYFWFNKLTKKAQYVEPEWDQYWKERVARSIVCTDEVKHDNNSLYSAGGNWFQYWDERMNESFCLNKLTNEYVVDGKRYAIR